MPSEIKGHHIRPRHATHHAWRIGPADPSPMLAASTLALVGSSRAPSDLASVHDAASGHEGGGRRCPSWTSCRERVARRIHPRAPPASRRAVGSCYQSWPPRTSHRPPRRQGPPDLTPARYGKGRGREGDEGVERGGD